jgi:hypothetical protein
MKHTKRTNITIKSSEVLVLRSGVAPPEIHCPNCGSQVQFLTPERAAQHGIQHLNIESMTEKDTEDFDIDISGHQEKK